MKKGFTLIELLVVIAIIAVIIGAAVPNLLSARERAKDTKKKSEIQQLKQALRLYYNDYNSYPTNFNGGIGKQNYIKGCGSLGTSECPMTPACTSAADFTAGGTDGCAVIYMKKFPSDLGSSMFYYPVASNTDDFCLKVPLDNASDAEIAKSQTKCATPCSGKVSSTDYAVCAD
ncbi:MAG: prepilin-type N-terminal cleavage/methylation domain-containing protein [Candidatus Gottesmanbacteria bacterium]|nr:prepilin-type N-terminal cleavage/methylation domain-containing protein [Candidatus Gottesmanbacteria bacterium]